MADEFLTVDMAKLKRSIASVRKNLKVAEAVVLGAIKQAFLEYAEKFIAKAQARAPVGEGALRGSATVLPEVSDNGQSVSVTAGFNLVYAHIRDVGGTIRPVRARALFIPLRKGARPGDKSLKWGVDFVLAQSATQKGNRYFSQTRDEAKQEMALWVSMRIREILSEQAALPKEPA